MLSVKVWNKDFFFFFEIIIANVMAFVLQTAPGSS